MRYYISGDGLVNDAINKLPFELHIPGGYKFCGPGTRLQERLQRGDKPLNGLDAGCKQHDIAYHNSKDLVSRHEADRELAKVAMRRFKTKDASFGERIAALGVAGVMKAKVKLGMGIGNCSYRKVLNSCLKSLKKIKLQTEHALKDIETYKSSLISRKLQRKSVKQLKEPSPNPKKHNNKLKSFNDNDDYKPLITVAKRSPILIASRKRKLNDSDNNYDNSFPPIKKIKDEEASLSLKRKFNEYENEDSDDDDDDDDLNQPGQKYIKTD